MLNICHSYLRTFLFTEGTKIHNFPIHRVTKERIIYQNMSTKCRSAGGRLIQKNAIISYAPVGGAGMSGLLQPSRREPLAAPSRGGSDSRHESAGSAAGAVPAADRQPHVSWTFVHARRYLPPLLPGRPGQPCRPVACAIRESPRLTRPSHAGCAVARSIRVDFVLVKVARNDGPLTRAPL